MACEFDIFQFEDFMVWNGLEYLERDPLLIILPLDLMLKFYEQCTSRKNNRIET